MNNNSRLQVRDNSRVILGLTGLFGSGCATLSNILAFDFVPRLERYIERSNDDTISSIFNNMDSLKQVQDDIVCDAKLKDKNIELKKMLEEREIKNILKRHKSNLTKNNFIYISFSSLIIFYVIKHLEDSTDAVLKTVIEGVLNKIGYTLEESVVLVNDFLNRYHKFKIDKIQKERLVGLFSKFHVIRDEIIKCKGRKELQDWGDNVRKFGNPFPGEKTKKRKAFTGRWLASIVDRYIRLHSNYKYFVIECFRNPQELYYFREKYSYFYLMAISARKESRLKWSGLGKEEFEKIDEREVGPIHKTDICEIDVGQCIDIADIVIQNDSTLDELIEKSLRYTAMILEPGSIKPSEMETLMHMAYTLSVRSNCLSRQVGAIITNSNGYVIGAGWNDVGEGQLSCGIKLGKDYNNNYLKNRYITTRPEEQGRYVCVKEKYMENAQLIENGKLGESDFCPVLHAEENAILQLAKYNSGVIEGGTMYTTTFPCTTCLKKIRQIGISGIVFSESYINPLIELYVKQSIKSIHLIPFEGVKSYSYFKLFKPYYNKKEQQIYLINNS